MGVLPYVEMVNLLISYMLNRGAPLIVVADYEDQAQKDTAGLFVQLRQRGKLYSQITEGLLDAMHYVHSHESPALQAADVLLYVLRRYLNRAEHPPAAWEQPIWDVWEEEFVKGSRASFRHWPEQFETNASYAINTGMRPKLPRPCGR